MANFGIISGPDGTACLVDALDAVRSHLVLVSCIGPGEIDRERLHQPGPLLLADLIDWAAESQDPAGDEDTAMGPDPLLIDLAERLWRQGLTVVPEYGVEGGVRIPLAIGHPDLPGELLVAVLTDDATYVGEPSLRRRERHWVQRLTARGWRVHTAFSTAVFTDPQHEAQRIVDTVLEVVDEALHRAKLHPTRPANSLNGDELSRIHEAIPWSLERGLEQGGAKIVNRRAYPIDGFPAVHGREGEPCDTCGTTIIKTKVGARGTYFCPVCQPVPVAD